MNDFIKTICDDPFTQIHDKAVIYLKIIEVVGLRCMPVEGDSVELLAFKEGLVTYINEELTNAQTRA